MRLIKNTPGVKNMNDYVEDSYKEEDDELSFIMQPGQLTKREIKLREQFVEEYVKDNDSYKALIRCGFIYSYSQLHHKKMLAEPFVQDMIRTHKHRLESVDNTDEVYIAEIVNVYRDVMNDKQAKPSERTGAAAKLAELKGLNKVQESKVSMDFTGGILKSNVYVGEDGNVIDIDTFSKIAQKQQQELRQKVLESVTTEED